MPAALPQRPIISACPAAMVSKHVQTLEEHLGARLLNRTTRRVSATEVGQHFYERCMRILSELEEAERAAGDLQTTPRGLLRVTAPVSFGTRQLAPAIADYLTSYPDVSIDLSLDDGYVDLLARRFDLAIRLGALVDSSLTPHGNGVVISIGGDDGLITGPIVGGHGLRLLHAVPEVVPKVASVLVLDGSSRKLRQGRDIPTSPHGENT